MTVCIAALCDSAKAVVTVTDHMLSNQDFSADGVALKMDSLSHNWRVLFSANDVTSIVPIVTEARRTIGPYLEDRELRDVTTIMQDSYQKQLQHRINSEILARWGFDIDSFRDHGLKKLGHILFRDIAQEIGALKLGCEFLVYGFDSGGEGHIFSIGDPGEVQYWDKVGMWAIGSGKYSALSSLFFHSVNLLASPQRAIYHACEAKFMAESSTGVGKKTFVSFARHGHLELYLSEEDIGTIRQAWETSGKPRMPQGILSAIEEMVRMSQKLEEGKKDEGQNTV